MGITQDEDLAESILGATDGTPIGNVGDRLKVDASVAPSVVPADKLVHFTQNLENNSSNDMSIDGSTTSVSFTAGPGTGETWYIFEINISIEDVGNNSIFTFGPLAGGLTNGVQVNQIISSTTYDFVNLKNNLQIVKTFTDSYLRGAANQFLNAVNFFTGSVELRQPVTLIGDNSDVIQAIVQDNLTGINTFEMLIEGYKVVS